MSSREQMTLELGVPPHVGARRAANQQRGRRMSCFTTRAGGAQGQQALADGMSGRFQAGRRSESRAGVEDEERASRQRGAGVVGVVVAP